MKLRDRGTVTERRDRNYLTGSAEVEPQGKKNSNACIGCFEPVWPDYPALLRFSVTVSLSRFNLLLRLPVTLLSNPTLAPLLHRQRLRPSGWGSGA
jgi:hypothetical protein